VELINATKMQAGYTLGMDPDGRERLVVVVKGTFRIPEAKGEPELADEQVPLVMADEFTGEPGSSATLHESDYAPFKPRCDVLLNGSAHAPQGRPAKEVRVGLRVGSMQKSFNVVGDRHWDKGLLSVAPSHPVAFTRMPISYDRAYGGQDADEKHPKKKRAFMDNPIGVGYYPLTKGKALVGKPLPNTEEPGRRVKSRSGKYRPMSLGPIGRNFRCRMPFAGTYDQNWQDNVFPFLPADFNPLYYQAAPPEQQIDHPGGGEEVELTNLSPRGRDLFRLPKIEVPIEFTNASHERTEKQAVLDTIILEPDEHRFLLVWRASIELRKNVFEIKQGVAGRMPGGWYRARDLGKTYHPSLQHLAAAQKGQAEEE